MAVHYAEVASIAQLRYVTGKFVGCVQGMSHISDPA